MQCRNFERYAGVPLIRVRWVLAPTDFPETLPALVDVLALGCLENLKQAFCWPMSAQLLCWHRTFWNIPASSTFDPLLLATAFGHSFWPLLLATPFGHSFWPLLLTTPFDKRSRMFSVLACTTLGRKAASFATSMSMATWTIRTSRLSSMSLATCCTTYSVDRHSAGAH